ncbi:Dynein light chain [Tulasnella sp. 403]|nr:Dynein light chain [Tulasnella sp. 403]
MEKLDATTPSEGGPREAPKITIKNVDMTEEMQKESLEIAQGSLEKFQVEKDIAAYCKREFDKKFGATWHVVVGKNFGSYVTHETKHFIYFYIGPLAFLIWKS